MQSFGSDGDVAQDRPEQDESDPMTSWADAPADVAAPTSPDRPSAARRASRLTRAHRRREGRRPRGPLRRRGSFVEFFRHRGCPPTHAPAGQCFSLDRRLASRDALPPAPMGLLVRDLGAVFVALADLRSGITDRTRDLDDATVRGDARRDCSSHPGSPTGSSRSPTSSRVPGGPVLRRHGRVGDRLERSGARDRLARRGSRPVRPGPEQPEPRRGAAGPGSLRPADAGLTSRRRGRTLPPVPARDRAGAG